MLFIWHDELGEVWVDVDNGIINIDYQMNGVKRTPYDFFVYVHPNGRITGKGARKNKDVIREILELYRSVLSTDKPV